MLKVAANNLTLYKIFELAYYQGFYATAQVTTHTFTGKTNNHTICVMYMPE